MRADIHDGQEQRSNQRPDTLMQDRSPPTRQGSLATHGRTIHWVKSVTSAAPADVRFAPESDRLLRCRGITRCSVDRPSRSKIRPPLRRCAKMSDLWYVI